MSKMLSNRLKRGSQGRLGKNAARCGTQLNYRNRELVMHRIREQPGPQHIEPARSIHCCVGARSLPLPMHLCTPLPVASDFAWTLALSLLLDVMINSGPRSRASLGGTKIEAASRQVWITFLTVAGSRRLSQHETGDPNGPNEVKLRVIVLEGLSDFKCSLEPSTGTTHTYTHNALGLHGMISRSYIAVLGTAGTRDCSKTTSKNRASCADDSQSSHR